MVTFKCGGKTTGLAFLAVAMLLPTVSALAREPALATLEIPFVYEAERGAIVLQLVANRRTAEVLLDTGAAYTVLSTEFIGLPGGGTGTARFSSSQPGVSGQGVWTRAALKLGGRDLGQHPVRVMDMSEVSRVYKRRVDGLLGQDILMRFDTIEIDFRARLLRLVRPVAVAERRPLQGVAVESSKRDD